MIKINQGSDTQLATDSVTDPLSAQPAHRQLVRAQSLGGDREVKQANAGLGFTYNLITSTTQIIAPQNCLGVTGRSLFVDNTCNAAVTIIVNMTGNSPTIIGAQAVLLFQLSAGAQGVITAAGPSMSVGTATLGSGYAWSALNADAASFSVSAQQTGASSGSIFVDTTSHT